MTTGDYNVLFDGTNYLVMEVPTQIVLGRYQSMKAANAIAIHLAEAEVGFQGFTPNFFSNTFFTPSKAVFKKPRGRAHLRVVK